jgi:replication factor A1
MNDDLTPYIDDILNALGDTSGKEVTREELEKELKKFIEYGVPLDHAKQTLIKKFGGSYVPSSSERMLVADLESGRNSVHVLCRVLHISPKDITVKGENRKIFYGILGDESGSISFTAWNDFELEKGDVVEISNAYTKEWQGETKLNLGDRTKIEKTDSSKIPESSLEPKEFKVKDLRSGLGSVEVTARILEFNEREVEVDGQKKNVFSGTLGDETGKAQYTSWHDFKLKEGDVIKITGGYVKSWKGIPQLTFDEKATVEKVKSSAISKKDIAPQKLLMYELAEKRGAMDVNVEGTVLEIRKGSGFVMRCPECNRTLQGEECSIHGSVKGVEDLRIKLVVDDGTGVVSGILDKTSTEKLLGKTYDELKKMSETEGTESIVEEMNALLFAHRISLRGNALGDAFGITILAKDASLADIDMDAESGKISKELEELL